MTLGELQKQFRDKLSAIYDAREANSITRIVFEKVLEVEALQGVLEKFRLLTEHQQHELEKILHRLLKHEPVQYVLGEADFFGLKFKVDSSVLIPRPETEELVQWIITDYKKKPKEISIVDIGSGSGCIAIVLSKGLPNATVTATEISPEAMKIAEENNRLNNTSVKFTQSDILDKEIPGGPYDVVVSNPPYIKTSEKSTLAANVFDFEPHLALFAPHEDHLVFYKVIASKALKVLKPSGALYFEVNASHAEEVKALLKGYEAMEIRPDISGKDRMVKAIKK